MILKTLVAAAGLSLSTAVAGFAATMDFEFSLTDGVNSISGLIEGLESDGVGQAADRITVQGVFDTYVFEVFTSNSFDVNASVIKLDTIGVTTNFEEGENDSALTARILFSGLFDAFSLTEFGASNGGARTFTFAQADEGQIAFDIATNVPEPPQVSTVPLPAGGVLLLSGLGGIAVFKRRKRRTA